MSNVEKTRALVLKRTKYGEADLVLHALTPQGAKISCMARGALKSKRRFGGGVLEPTHYIEMLIRPSPRADGLGSLEEAKLIDGFEGLRSSYERLDTALSLVDTIDRICQPGDTGSNHLFDLLGNGLRILQTTRDIDRTKVHFLLKLLYHQGVLEAENWMGPFLSAPLSAGDEAKLPAVTGAQQKWMQEQVETYLKTAERF